jgi:hypothetical protein
MGSDSTMSTDMPVPPLAGPFPLTQAAIGIHHMPGAPGTYCLGSIDLDGTFTAAYVGRADDDLAACLRHHIGSDRYNAFVYVLATSPRNAFAMQCELYHALRPRDNHAHPARADDATWTCPGCRQL